MLSCGSLCRNTSGLEAPLRTFPLKACTLCSHSVSVPDTLSMAWLMVRAGNVEIPPEKWDFSSYKCKVS